jgi:hypothetical protein
MTSPLAAKFRKAVAAGFGWAHENKLKALACLSLATFGAYEATGYAENALSQGPNRDTQLTALNGDIEKLTPIARQFHALRDFQEMAQNTPDRLQAPVDMAQLDKDVKALGEKYTAAESATMGDFVRSRDISLKDMDDVRGKFGAAAGWDVRDLGLDTGPTSKQIRACENYLASGHEPPPLGLDLESCVNNEQLNSSAGRFLMACLLLLLTGSGYAVAKEWHQEEKLEQKRLEAEQLAAAAAQAATPPPMVLSAPTKISAPLKLKLKIPTGRAL